MKKITFLLSGIIILVLLTTGCFEGEEQNAPSFENLTLESDIVELNYGNIEYAKDNNVIVEVEVQFLFRVIVNRDVNFYVTAEFYDVNDNLLNASSPKRFELPNGYSETEASLGPANRISYNGKNLSDVDHVVLKTEELQT